MDEFVQRTRDIYNELLERLRELKPPDSMREQVDHMLDRLSDVAAFLPQLQKAVAANDQAKTSELVHQIGDSSAVASEIASDLGLTSCINAGNVAGPSASPTPTASF
ncbi:MAG: hypothetical protein M3290_00870 [Actinomycetota bacterium]|nr:hypothetical protein [Actinomycetota bacterium]